MSSLHDRRSKQYLIFRLFIVLVGFGLVSFYQLCLGPAFKPSTFGYLYGLLGLYLVLAVGMIAAATRWPVKRSLVRWQVVGDLFLQALLIWGTGGVFSVFSLLPFVTLAAATAVISARGAFVLATLATVLLAAATLAHKVGIAPVGSQAVRSLSRHEESAFVVSYLLGSVLALYAVSTLGSRFSHGLRRMEGIQSAILENMAEGLVAFDQEGRLVLLNREARKLLGSAEADAAMKKRRIEGLFPGESSARLREAFQRDGRRRIKLTLQGQRGKAKPVEVKISSVPDDSGKTRCRIGLISDLTLQHEMQAAERRLEKLKDLQLMALGLAHEIRNPLASIRGCAQELRRLVPQSAQPARFLEIVCKESDRLDGIIEEFLCYARSGPVDLVPLDLLEVVEEAVVLLKSRPGLGTRELVLVTPEARPKILGDRNRLIQVFLNLGLNAVDATSPEVGKVTVSVLYMPSPGFEPPAADEDDLPGITVEFRDNGQGISGEDLKKLFTPFFTTKSAGNGLGLCIVDRVVREHRGALDVASVEGAGATFRVWFPILQAQAGKEGTVDNTEEIAMTQEPERLRHG